MKKFIQLLTFSVVLFSSVLSFSQPAIEWKKCFGGSEEDFATSVEQTNDGGYIVAGYSSSTDGDLTTNNGLEDYWIVKLNNVGNIQWQRSYGGYGYDDFTTIHQTNDGGYIIGGSTISNDGDVAFNHGTADCWILKLDSLGAIEWQKSLGGSESDYTGSIQQTLDGGYILVGSTESNDGDVTVNYGGSDFWIVKLNNVGIVEWQKSLGGSAIDQGIMIIQTSEGGYIACGGSRSNDGNVNGHHGDDLQSDCWIVKLDTIGNIQWQKSYGGVGEEVASFIQQTFDGGYIFSGAATSIDGDVTGVHGDYDSWVVKINNAGMIEWQKTLGGTGQERGNSVQQTNDGGFVVAGSTSSNDGDVSGNHGIYPFTDYWLVKLDGTGSIQWQKCFGGTQGEYSDKTLFNQTNNNGYILAGYSSSNDGDVSGNHGNDDYWIIKLAPDINSNCSSIFTIFPDTAITHNWYLTATVNGTPPFNYAWSWGDGNLSTMAYPSHTYDSAGYYTICLTITDSIGCTSTYCDSSTYLYKTDATMVSVQVVEDLPNSISVLPSMEYNIKISPNPSNSIFRIQSISNQATLADLTGKTLLITKLKNGEAQIDVSNLANGIYFLQTDKGNTQKLIVQH